VEQQCALEPATADDVIFGVQSTLVVERWFAETLLRSWSTTECDHMSTPVQRLAVSTGHM
jgi:hypothetical protein